MKAQTCLPSAFALTWKTTNIKGKGATCFPARASLFSENKMHLGRRARLFYGAPGVLPGQRSEAGYPGAC